MRRRAGGSEGGWNTATLLMTSKLLCLSVFLSVLCLLQSLIRSNPRFTPLTHWGAGVHCLASDEFGVYSLKKHFLFIIHWADGEAGLTRQLVRTLGVLDSQGYQNNVDYVQKWWDDMETFFPSIFHHKHITHAACFPGLTLSTWKMHEPVRCVCVMLHDVSRANHWNLKTRAPCKRSAQAPPPLSNVEMFLAAGNKVGKSHQLRRRRASRLRQRLFSRSAEWQADKTDTVVLRPRKRTVCCCWSFSQSVAIKSKYRYVTVRWNPRLNVLKELKSARVNKHKPKQWHTPPLRSLLFSHTHPKCGGLIPFFFQLTFLIMKGKLSRLLPASPRAPAASQHWLIQRSQWNHKCLHMETSLILFSFPSPSRHE